MPTGHLLLFAVTAIGLVCTPGPDMVYVLTRGIGQGRAAGLISAAGVCSGYLVHTAFAVVGLSALIASSQVAFEIVRWVGVAYLVVLGVRMLRARTSIFELDPAARASRRALFAQGIATSLLNPKALIIYLSFLPQFVDRQAGSVGLQLLLLGLTNAALCLVVYTLVAAASGTLGDRLARRPSLARAVQSLTGLVLVALGARLATDRR